MFLFTFFIYFFLHVSEEKIPKKHRISHKISTQLLAVNAAQGQDETSHWHNADTSVLPVAEGQESSLPCTVCSSTSCHRDTPAPTKTGRPWETYCVCSSSSIYNCLKKWQMSKTNRCVRSQCAQLAMPRASLRTQIRSAPVHAGGSAVCGVKWGSAGNKQITVPPRW